MKNLILIFVLLFGFGAGPVDAQTQTVTFNATVTSVFNHNGNGLTLAANLGIATGNAITGSYSFDSAHPDFLGLSYWGVYTNISLPFSLTLQTSAATYNFQSNSNRIQIFNGDAVSPTSTSPDSIEVLTLTQPVVGNLPVPASLGQMILTWSDSSQTVLSSDGLVAPPQSPWGIKQIRLLAFDDGNGNQFGLFAQINSFSVAAPPFVSVDWKTAGDNLLTRDPASGLDWLELTQTGNRSYNEVSAQLGAGGEFAGFRFATQAEVADLFGKFGLPFGFTPLSTALHAGAQSFHDFFGTLVAFDANLQAARTEGLYEPATPTPGAHPRIGVLLTATAGGTSTGAHLDTQANSIYGSYLVRSSDAPPIANAGPDQTVDEGTSVALDGSAILAAQGGPLSYSWTQIAGVPVSLSSPNSAAPGFTSPTVGPGGDVLTFQLVVTEGSRVSEPDIVNVHVVNVNKIPVADAGPDQLVQEGSPVALNGSNSFDADADPLSFSWTQTTGVTVALNDSSLASPSFIAPLIGPAGATLTFDLVVHDGFDYGAADSVSVFVENVNHPPVANAGADQTRDENSLVTLDGTASTDPDADSLSYRWTQRSGTAVALSSPASANPTYTAPLVGSGGETLVFSLIVNDGLVDSQLADEVSVTIQNINDPPACNLALANPSVLWPPNHKLEAVTITNVSDPNNDTVAIYVTGVTQDEPTNGSGDGDIAPDAVLQANKALLRVERASNGNGRVYRIAFSASDGQGGMCTGSVNVGVPQSMKPGNSAVDDGQIYDSTQP